MVILKEQLTWRAPRRGAVRRAARGFTAVELMVVVAIVAILASLAAPSFKYLVERWRVRDAVEAMTTTLYLARSEAVKRGGDVVVAQGTDGACETGEWRCGWTVSSGSGGDIQSFSVHPNLNVTSKSAQTELQFDRWGAFDEGQAGFTISPAPAGAASSATMTLCVSNGGRIETKQGDQQCS